MNFIWFLHLLWHNLFGFNDIECYKLISNGICACRPVIPRPASRRHKVDFVDSIVSSPVCAKSPPIFLNLVVAEFSKESGNFNEFSVTLSF